jgi:two-component system, OmpR family, KDP operon response regulator KdpE
MSSAGPLVLVADDEPQMRRFLRASLASHGYRVVETESGEETVVQAKAYNPDLVLLDLGLPDVDGLAVIKRLREWSKAPVVVISARDREQDKIDALDLGADDYLTKPFGTGELLARMRVALRHVGDLGAPGSPTIAVGDLRLDVDARRVFVKDREVHLTPIEYKLFVVLMKNAGKVLTHRQLLKDVWGPSHVDQTQYLRVYMVQLRHKLEEEPVRPRYLVTEPGVGYRLRDRP